MEGGIGLVPAVPLGSLSATRTFLWPKVSAVFSPYRPSGVYICADSLDFTCFI